MQRLLSDRRLIDVASAYLLPLVHRICRPLSRGLVRPRLRSKLGGIASVADMQLLMAELLERVIRESTLGFTVSGIEGLSADHPYLFIANHRDIVLDSGLLNYALYQGDLPTCRIAVGDNLLTEAFAEDLIRVNKGFVVRRGVDGAKGQLKALQQTSQFVRVSLEDGESVWIAQREGRAKDGLDMTEPALLKMLTLAHRKEVQSVDEFLQRVRLVPVAMSYELDPCDLMKARELAVRETTGEYNKAPNEDMDSIGLGITGFKGRVHLHFCQPVRGDFADAEALAEHIDAEMASGLKLYPTFVDAAARLGLTEVVERAREPGRMEPREQRADDDFARRCGECPQEFRPHLLTQYANIARRILGDL